MRNWLESCLEGLPKVRVAVFGDFCIDAYWLIDPNESELSVETGLPVRRVRRQRYSLGGAGNIVANLEALGVKQIYAVGLVGRDLFGDLMLDMLWRLNVNCEGMLADQDDWQTLVYAKPCIGEIEQNRIDFGGFNALMPQSVEAMGRRLDRAAAESDVAILNQQVPGGISTGEMIEQINAVIARHPECKFVVDSRHRAELYRGAILKLNAHEASRLTGQPRDLDERVTAEQARKCATELFQETAQPVFVTRGENGIVFVDASGLQEVPGIQVIERTDTVGAGDTTVAALAAVLGEGGEPLAAAKLANVAASIVVRKIQTTGTAGPQEIRQVGPAPDYVYLPELADDMRRAKYMGDTEIEIIRELPGEMDIRHAIFDHDGTISTLRQGWEHIMEPMMVRAILGPRYQDADEVLYHKVVDHTRRFIDKTTGVQTLVQMQGLVELVRQFGCVTREQILDLHGYKAVYNDELLAMVRRRVEKLQRDELNPVDFQIKNARQILDKLYAGGVRLYLASGTDQADVVAEAEALGYAHLFEGRIFGAVGDVKIETKRIVLERIIHEHNLGGSQFTTFGDGPVEIRETRRRGGVAIGVAGDEVRRFGLNTAKRARLIRAGADLIIPDFSQLDRVLKVLRLEEG
jgi:rfaE bifunctional protein kinase chain/domain